MQTDDEIQAQQRARAEEQRRQQVEDIKWLAAHKQGRRFMWRLLATCGVHHNPYNASGSATAFNCGRLNVGLEFQAELIDLAPDAYLQMLKEGKSE